MAIFALLGLLLPTVGSADGFLLRPSSGTLGDASKEAAGGSQRQQARSQRLLQWWLGNDDDHPEPIVGLVLTQLDEDIPSPSRIKDIPVPAFPYAHCEGSSYFIDWGSSGMKVYMTHAQPQTKLRASVQITSASKKPFMVSFKIPGVTEDTLPDDLVRIFDTLLLHLGSNVTAGLSTVLATGGMRLLPRAAESAWGVIRGWAVAHPFFGLCAGSGRDADCRTLAGSEEARYEMESMLQTPTGRHLEAQLKARGEVLGFASAGGASIQVGLYGDRADLERCLADLGSLSSDLDPQRADIAMVAGRPALLVSFLSAFGGEGPGRCKDVATTHVCDYQVGGVNQMRASFGEFLAAHGNQTNPCLSAEVRMENNSACSFFNTTACVIDRYGGYVSALPPAPATLQGQERRDTCNSAVESFVDSDLVLSRWSGSPTCRQLAGNITQWAMLTRFSDAMAGVTDAPVTFAEVLNDTKALPFESAQDAQLGKVGAVLNSELLTRVLGRLGLQPLSQLRGAPSADWATAAMRDRGVEPGWLEAGSCP